MISAVAFAVIAGTGMVALSAGVAAILPLVARAISARRLAPLAWGMVAVLWFVWLSRDWSQYTASAVAHTCGGMLVGWVLAGPEDGAGWIRRLPSRVGPVVAAVAAVGVAWEIAEWSADQLLGTHLSGGPLDTGLDLAWDLFGGWLGFVLRRSSRAAAWQRRHAPRRPAGC